MFFLLFVEYVNTLLSKGLNAQAAAAFQNYIEKAHLDKAGLAAVCYRLGGIYMDLKEYELSSRTSIGKTAEKNEQIVARIGKNEITEQQISQAIAKLPQWAQDNFKTKEGKLKFICKRRNRHPITTR